VDCPKCRHVSLPGSNFCEKCGYDLKAYSRQKPRPVEPSYNQGYGQGYGQAYPASRPAPAPAPVPAPSPSPTLASSSPSAPAVRPAVQPANVQRPTVTARPQVPPVSQPVVPVVAKPAPFAYLEDPTGATRFALTYDRTEIGRRSVQDQILPEIDLTAVDRDGSTSRQHAVIVKEENFVVLEDRGSRNGTFVDGKRLEIGQQVSLNVGMEIRFGTVRLNYRASS
jgi:hypothetical protein